MNKNGFNDILHDIIGPNTLLILINVVVGAYILPCHPQNPGMPY